ncbi:transporter substrate-binding domain-containing protein [Arsukibacterium sp.]|uniref:transporter substrate-binding domain-containing protein n=1 Tax=Arsukibacterium sp. TaxID=1977258 RepID=UPI00299F4BEA|nr:transporter substrate-binding domain-containing protein [Arsukibacterium sp.]MDX1677541.1 transporter substrate-binding domain-containing protein [Arsukibacterium sp.]
MFVSLLLPLLLVCQPTIKTAPEISILADAIELSTEQWQGFTQPDHTGAYFDLVRLIYKPYQPRLLITFTNYNRALTMVRQKKSDMTLAISAANNSGILLSDQPIDQDKIMAIYNPQYHQLNKLDDLKPLRLAWNLAYDFDTILGLENTGYEVQSIEQGIELTLKQRVDVYLAEQSQVVYYLAKQQQSLTPLNAKLIATDDIYAGFADTETGRQLKCIWDSRFQSLLNSGELQHFYQQYDDFYLKSKQ